mmetsp:Transcript_42780/g.110315  ORF Transcript_42780/g.110315 Transcript_42780/m.110315 type:complete len:159 (-) Transcript_42780:120-596(-)
MWGLDVNEDSDSDEEEMQGGGFEVHEAACTHCGVLLRFPPSSIAISCASCRGLNYQGQCSSCTRSLIFPPTVSLVSCSVCHAVTEFAISSMRQAGCPGCATTVLFPVGSPAVRCSVCSTVFHIQQEGQQQTAVVIENPGDDEDAVALGYEIPTVAPRN